MAAPKDTERTQGASKDVPEVCLEQRSQVLGGELEDLAANVARAAEGVFKHREWRWRDVGVPDAAQIAACVTHLIERVREVGEGQARSGGFAVDHFYEDGWETYSVTLEIGDLTKELKPAPRQP